MLARSVYQQIEKQIGKGKTILLLGARRVGKTTISRALVKQYGGAYYNCDLPEVQELLQNKRQATLRQLIGGAKLVLFDEAQVVPEIGRSLKILHDSFPDVQVIATGSSSFDLVNQAAEPLTGRSRSFTLYPLSFAELVDNYGLVAAQSMLPQLLLYGAYPDPFLAVGEEKKEELLDISNNYLYRDVLQLTELKRTRLLKDILRLLAFQIGSETSLNKIANQVNASVHTVQHYLELLEKSFVIFSLGGYARNLAKEVGKSRKYYFYDLGIRNALLRDFKPLALRNDIGGLWENFCIVERLKNNAAQRRFVNSFFWRTYDQQELDYLEEIDGQLHGFEIKYSEQRWKPPVAFAKAYPNSSTQLIHRDNFHEFVLPQ